jgi:hypothetical protein
MKSVIANFILRALSFLATSTLLIACQNGDVTLNELSIDFNGISFPEKFQDFKTSTLQKFDLQGNCSSDITQIFYRYDSKSPWTEINSTNGTVTCNTNQSFTLRFEVPLSAIKIASGFTESKSGNGPQLNLEFYGKTREYKSKNAALTVTQLGESKRDGLVATPETTLSNLRYQLRGRLIAFAKTSEPLSSSNFKVRQGSLRPTK